MTMDIEWSQYFPAELFVLCCPNKANLSFEAIVDTIRRTLSDHITSQLSYVFSAALTKPICH